ncbi:hypothetical protein GBAR_LOCUS14321 [Geodia barretti]|uniref:Uncharacterized protein n=1 Tax=Geodia barretti TaxID=519541 RepID=A0AA35S7K9_GEOBA|nr:hypothetical protein GBAR_LOCUS14321 [Geodia barretti]
MFHSRMFFMYVEHYGMCSGRQSKIRNYILPKLRCQRFSIFCWHKNGRRDKPTIFNTLTTVGVRNGNICHLAAPIPISPKFHYYILPK